MVPEGWNIKPVGDLFEVQLGKMLNKAAKEQSPQYSYLGNTNVQWGYFDLSDLKTMHFTARDKEKFTLQPDDIVMCEGGEVGRCAIWQGSEQVVFYQKALHRLRSKGEVIPQFFQNYMEKIAGTKLLDNYTSRTSIAHLTREKLVSLPVKLPPLPEQKKIAQILSTWDKAITTTEQLLANSQIQKKALMQQLLTGKRRLLDKNGVRFCGEWESKQLSKLGEVIGGLTYSPSDVTDGSGTLVLRSSNVQNGRLSFDDNVYVTCTASEKSVTRENDILLCVRNGSRALIGKSALLKDQAVGCFHGAFMSIFRAKEPLFIFQLLQSSLFYREVRKNLGATINSINGSDLKKFTFNVPTDKAEREKIAAILSTADQEISALQQKLDHLKKEKKALMQQLLTGKRRVKPIK